MNDIIAGGFLLGFLLCGAIGICTVIDWTVDNFDMTYTGTDHIMVKELKPEDER